MKRGFTLVELIVVIIILGILAAVGIPQYRKSLERARGAEAYAGLASIQEAEKIYYATNETYLQTADPIEPDEMKILDISLPQKGWQFKVVAPTPASAFTATATRRTGSGPCSAAGVGVITVDQTGTLIDTAWRTCVDGL